MVLPYLTAAIYIPFMETLSSSHSALTYSNFLNSSIFTIEMSVDREITSRLRILLQNLNEQLVSYL
jgi:hypothetical protein